MSAKRRPRPKRLERKASAAHGAPSRRPARAWHVAAALAVLCLACYLANGRTAPLPRAADTVPNRLLPFCMLTFHTTTLDPFAAELSVGGKPPWYTRTRRSHLVSLYPIGESLAALPIYLPAVLGFALRGQTDPRTLLLASEMLEKITASLLAALAVAFLYGTLQRSFSRPTAFWTALAFGLGSSMWATASQLMWQHGGVVLGVTLGLFFVFRPRPTPRQLALGGAGFALALASRPTSGVFLAAAIAAQLIAQTPWRTRLAQAGWLALGAAPLALFVTIYNLYWFGTWLGGYGFLTRALRFNSLHRGLLGLLISPNRGLFIFTPLALLGFVGLARSFSRFRKAPLPPLLGLAATANLLAAAAYADWPGGWSFGPRYLVDILPVLALGAALELGRLRRYRLLLVAALAWSILVQLNGAFCYPASHWNQRTRDFKSGAFDWHHWELAEDFEAWRDSPFGATPY